MSKFPRPRVVKIDRKKQGFEGMDIVVDENEVNGARCKATSEKKERREGNKNTVREQQYAGRLFLFFTLFSDGSWEGIEDQIQWKGERGERESPSDLCEDQVTRDRSIVREIGMYTMARIVAIP